MKKLLALWAALACADALAAEVELAPDALFAVVTGKGGAAKGMAHNHFITAKGFQATLSYDDANPTGSTFALEAAVATLQVDPFDLEKKHFPRLRDLGLVAEEFSEVPEKDRGKIRESMLDASQLNAAKFPAVKARVVRIEAKEAKRGAATFPYTVTLALEVVGKTVEKPAAARAELAAGTLTVEAVASYKFSDFGIKPYSAFLGAVKVLDEFHVYVDLRGRVPEPSAAPAAVDPAPATAPAAP